MSIRRSGSVLLALVLAIVVAACTSGGSDTAGTSSAASDGVELSDWVAVVESRDMRVVERRAGSSGDPTAVRVYQAEEHAHRRVLVRTTAVLYDTEGHAVERTLHKTQRRFPETILRRGRVVVDIIETWDSEAARSVRTQLIARGFHG